MKYMGSKNRYAKELLAIILKDRKPNQWYCEPFVGGCNMIDKVDGNRMGSDNNPYLIACMKQIRDCPQVFPKSNTDCTEETYRDIKNNPHLGDKAAVGYCGFALSYGGKWFGGWRRDSENKRDYVKEAYNNAIKQSKNLQNLRLHCCDYKKLNIPKNSIIYCDPPYKDTTKYKDNFNHDEFWDWVRLKDKEGHIIFVSEYEAPDDFECIWSKKVNNSLDKDTGSKQGIEKLFKLRRN